MSEKIIEHSSISMYEGDMTKYSIVVNRRRAFPEVRDGLKPVQRRVIYAAYRDGLTSPGRRDKSASLVGTTMKYYHPHGNSCCEGSTPIYLLNGTFTTIKEIFDSNIESVDILAVDPKTGKVIPAKATNFRVGKYIDKEYQIHLSNGHVIRCSDNHPFLMSNLLWMRADEIPYNSRLYERTMRRHVSTGRLAIDGDLVQNIVHDYYHGVPETGFDRHHIDGNFDNNIPENIAKILKQNHASIHSKSESALNGLEKGRESMFSDNGKYREETRRKNSILASEFNKDQGIRRFKAVINDMRNKGIEITEANYEMYRGKVYNLPMVSRLIQRHPECGVTFEELVNYEPVPLSELYNQRVNQIISPIEFDKVEATSPIEFLFNGRFKIYEVFDNMLDNHIPLTVENYYRFAVSSVDKEKISYLISLYRIERPYVDYVSTIDVDHEPVYDFTVFGVENMMIPVASTENMIVSNFIGYNVPMISAHNSIYDAIVTLASWYKTKIPLFYGHGNWGNVSGAGAAAERYTECSLSNFGYDTLIDELAQSANIIDYIPTYKRNNDREPEYLPVKVPLLLVNGTFGIGVGMSVNIPSHNLAEVVEATRKLMKNPKSDVVLIPDLCQSCHLINTNWKDICNSGNGPFKVRGDIITETDKKGNTILRIVSLPDTVTTTAVYDKINSMIEAKQLPMIKDIFKSLKDSKPNIVIHLKQGTDPNYVKQVIYAKTDVQKSFTVNFEAVDVNGIDTRRFSYKDYLLSFIDQRMNTKFRLYCNKLQQVMTRHHQVDAFVKVIESGKIDTIIAMIKKQKTTDDTPIIEYIIKNIKLTDVQAKFIIGVNLSRLSMGHLNAYKAERKDLEEKMNLYRSIVTDPNGTLIKKEIDEEMIAIAKKYSTPRLCDVIDTASENEVPKGIFKIVITERNYIRKIPDVDKISIVKKDNPKFIIRVDNTENVLIFDNKGKVFNLPVSKIPISDRNSSGTDVRILIKNLTSDIISVIPEPMIKKISECGSKHYLTVLTRSNTIKKLDIEDFLTVNPSGLMYSKIRDDDEVVGIALAQAKLDVVICSGHNALRTGMKEIPLYKRIACGSKAMDTTDPINGLSIIYPDASDIVVVTKNGKFNRFNITMLPSYARARKGVGVIKLDSNDEIFNIFGVNESDKIRVLTTEGVEEINVSDIKVKSRIAAGTKMLLTKGIIIKADVVR